MKFGFFQFSEIKKAATEAALGFPVRPEDNPPRHSEAPSSTSDFTVRKYFQNCDHFKKLAMNFYPDFYLLFSRMKWLQDF